MQKKVQERGLTNSGQLVQNQDKPATSYQPINTSTNNLVQSHTDNRKSIAQMQNPPATQISPNIGPKLEHPAPKPTQLKAFHLANTKIETSPKEQQKEIKQQGTNPEIDSSVG